MDALSGHIDESALDLSQHSSSYLIELPVNSICMPGTDKIPFYLEASGQLVLANVVYEHVNDRIVLRHVPVPPVSGSQVNEEAQDFSTVISTGLQDPLNLAESENVCDEEEGDEFILKQKVKSILSNASFVPDCNGNIIVKGHNVSKIIQTAEILKNFRMRRSLSQQKLSELINRNTTGELKFSQTFLCRFENLDVTLRVALRANPYLERWLKRMEEEEKIQEDEVEALHEVLDAETIGNFLTSHHSQPSVSSYTNMESTIVDSTELGTELLDLRERISPPPPPPTSSPLGVGQKEVPVPASFGDPVAAATATGEEEQDYEAGMELPKRRNRKQRVYFNESAVGRMMEHFERNPCPRGRELTDLAESLGYGRESVRLWFVNRRYQLKLASKQ